MEFDNGALCEVDQFTSDKAKQLVSYLNGGHNDYATLIECRLSETRDIVGINIKPELSQLRANDIRPDEPIFVHIDKQDKYAPAIYAMRDSFPRKVPHLNLEYEGWPASLCLYSESYRDIKPFWTAARFVERIREWLKETAKGTLHSEDQPLEPLLFSSDTTVIIPHDLFDTEDNTEKLVVVDCSENGTTKAAFRVIRTPANLPENSELFKMVVVKVELPVQQHGIINHRPQTLQDLHAMVKASGFDLLSELRKTLSAWDLNDNNLRKSHLAIIARFPKKRSTHSEVEAMETWIFASTKTTIEVGVDIDAYQDIDGSFSKNAHIVGGNFEYDQTKRGQNIPVDLLNPTYELSAATAAHLNAYSNAETTPITVIGAGAIGSNVILNAVRSGFGTWTIIDDDILLPHNLARHALDGFFLGRSKAFSIQTAANKSVSGNPVALAIEDDVINPRNNKEAIEQCLSDASLIIDMSASISVARHLAHDINSDARRVSMFLSPSGRDLVIMAEDKERTVRLDLLEMIYYRELRLNAGLADHLATTSKTRYANSCRDLSSRISQDHVALHAAIGSNNLRRIVSDETACIKIYRTDEDMQISVTPVPLDQFTLMEVSGWQVYLSQSVAIELLRVRGGKLPNETGGVLIGAFNTQQKIIYIVDLLTAPTDSLEYPDAFIRGHKDLAEQVDAIQSVTAGNLTYVGEWHSHPDGAKCRPSNDDKKVIQWIDDYMSGDGLPPVMLIVGEGGEICTCVGQNTKSLRFEDVREKFAVAV